MQKPNGDKNTFFGVALIVQAVLHYARSLLLNTVSELFSASPALPYVYGVLSLILKLAVFLIPTVAYLKMSGTSLPSLLAPIETEPRKKVPTLYKILQFIVAAAITLNAANLAGMATDAVYTALGITTPPSALPDELGLQIISLISAVILAPFLEELLFRGVALNALSDFGKRGILLSGLLFALMHYSVYSLLYAFVAGYLIAYFTKRTNSLKTAIGLHFTNNLLTFASLLIGCYISEKASEIFGYVLTGITLPFAVFGAVMLIKEARSTPKKPTEQPSENKPKLSPGILFYILFSISMCLITR